ncbi:hypothetical protein ABD07_00260 [Nitrosomonas oligotropha]|nr:hypothetical protein [Nitrosomonas oligotropha]
MLHHIKRFWESDMRSRISQLSLLLSVVTGSLPI